MLFDNHIHIINEATTPPEIAAGRWEISHEEMKAILTLAHLLRGIDWPDEIDAAAGIADVILASAPRYRRIKHLIALYFMSTSQQVRVIRRMLADHQVKGANVLVIPGTPARGVREVLEAVNSPGKWGRDLRVFVPYEYANDEGVTGIKHYPSLFSGPFFNRVSDAACALDLPIISHCSQGGVRHPDVTQAKAKSANLPGRWLDVLRDRPVRLCLAHGGGSKWARWMSGTQTQAWSLDYLMREAHPPTEWAGRLWIDTAFHDDQDGDAYTNAVSRACAPWRVLWGSDWPLHLPQWSYGQACEWGRVYWGDQVEAQAEFSGR